jgi:hypothetical protein
MYSMDYRLQVSPRAAAAGGDARWPAAERGVHAGAGARRAPGAAPPPHGVPSGAAQHHHAPPPPAATLGGPLPSAAFPPAPVHDSLPGATPPPHGAPSGAAQQYHAPPPPATPMAPAGFIARFAHMAGAWLPFGKRTLPDVDDEGEAPPAKAACPGPAPVLPSSFACFEFASHGKCIFGETCPFSHSNVTLPFPPSGRRGAGDRS